MKRCVVSVSPLQSPQTMAQNLMRISQRVISRFLGTKHIRTSVNHPSAKGTVLINRMNETIKDERNHQKDAHFTFQWVSCSLGLCLAPSPQCVHVHVPLCFGWAHALAICWMASVLACLWVTCIPFVFCSRVSVFPENQTDMLHFRVQHLKGVELILDLKIKTMLHCHMMNHVQRLKHRNQRLRNSAELSTGKHHHKRAQKRLAKPVGQKSKEHTF